MWRLFKWVGGTVLLLIVLAVLLRGPLFRLCFHFQNLRERRTGAPLPHVVSGHPSETRIDPVVSTCIDDALDATAEALEFSTGHSPGDVSGALASGTANCIGYAAVFTQFCEVRLQTAVPSDDWRVLHLRGLLFCGSFNLHRLFSSPFWKDHDICVVENRSTGQRLYIDPTLFDAAHIRRVNGPVN